MNGWRTFIYYPITIISHLSLRGQRERKKINTQIKPIERFIAAVIIVAFCFLDSGKLSGAECIKLVIFLVSVLSILVLAPVLKSAKAGPFEVILRETEGMMIKPKPAEEYKYPKVVSPSRIEFSRDTEGKPMKLEVVESSDLKR